MNDVVPGTPEWREVGSDDGWVDHIDPNKESDCMCGRCGFKFQLFTDYILSVKAVRCPICGHSPVDIVHYTTVAIVVPPPQKEGASDEQRN